MSICKKIHQIILRHRRYGKIHLVSASNIPLTVTREVRYHLSGGHTELDFYDYNELAEFCKKQGCKTTTGNML